MFVAQGVDDALHGRPCQPDALGYLSKAEAGFLPLKRPEHVRGAGDDLNAVLGLIFRR